MLLAVVAAPVYAHLESGLLAGSVSYSLDPLEPPLEGNVLACSTRPAADVDARPLTGGLTPSAGGS